MFTEQIGFFKEILAYIKETTVYTEYDDETTRNDIYRIYNIKYKDLLKWLNLQMNDGYKPFLSISNLFYLIDKVVDLYGRDKIDLENSSNILSFLDITNRSNTELDTIYRQKIIELITFRLIIDNDSLSEGYRNSKKFKNDLGTDDQILDNLTAYNFDNWIISIGGNHQGERCPLVRKLFNKQKNTKQ